MGWWSAPIKSGWSFSLLGGGHWQNETDVNDDVWADLPGYSRAVVRPRVFWDDGKGKLFFATVGFTAEDRFGGTVDDAILPAAGVPYEEALTTRRLDGGAVGQASRASGTTTSSERFANATNTTRHSAN